MKALSTKPGRSPAKAIRVNAVEEEYAWLTRRLGRKGVDWLWVKQELTRDFQDVLTVRLRNGKQIRYYFKLSKAMLGPLGVMIGEP